MKLLFCRDCYDVVALHRAMRSCNCGLTHGRYLEDGAHAEVFRDAIVIGIDNFTMQMAVQAQNSADAGHRTLAAWVMGKDAPRVRWEQ